MRLSALAFATVAVATLVAASCVALPVQAQYSLNWHTMEGGGGRSTGGAYTLSGTIGQADADYFSLCSLDGGVYCAEPFYELTGGFWDGPRSQACGPGLECILRDGFESPG